MAGMIGCSGPFFFFFFFFQFFFLCLSSLAPPPPLTWHPALHPFLTCGTGVLEYSHGTHACEGYFIFICVFVAVECRNIECQKMTQGQPKRREETEKNRTE